MILEYMVRHPFSTNRFWLTFLVCMPINMSLWGALLYGAVRVARLAWTGQ